MQIGYTEFSYGYAFTENLIRSASSAPRGAPVFPNLVQEATLGYDVRINLPGVPLFFQYKLPAIMRRATAKEISQHGLSISVPFFRMPLMRKDISRQHRQLIRLEQRYPGQVFYASPCLATVQDFNLAYNAASVHFRSALFSPTDIGQLPDNKRHHVSYEDGSAVGYFCSEPKEIPATNADALSTQLIQKFGEQQYRSLRTAAREARTAVSTLARPATRDIEGSIEERLVQLRRKHRPESFTPRERVLTDLLVAREIARLDFGVELAIAQPR